MQTKRRTRPGSEFIRNPMLSPLTWRECTLDAATTVKGLITVSTTQALLERWKLKKGFSNNSEVARALKVRPSAVSHWQTGRAHANPAVAAKMAEECGLDVLPILAAVEADRAHEPDTRRIWARYGKGAFIALLMLSGTVVAHPPPPDVSGHYAKRRKFTRSGPCARQGGQPGPERRKRHQGHRRRPLRVWARSQATP